MRRVAFLWLPHWSTDRLRRLEPPARQEARQEVPQEDCGSPEPLVVSRAEARHLVIAAACPAAVRLGLHPGMKLSHAQAMVPRLRVAAETPQADADALAGLAAWCLRYTPLTRALPPDGIWLDVSGCAHLHGGETALMSDLAARLGDAGLHARIALADTPGAAHALAHHAEAALTIAPAGVPAALLALPVEALRLDGEAVVLLHRFGLRRIADLAALPRAPLTRRLGAGVARRLDQALGRVQEPIEPALPELPAAQRLAFAEPLLTADGLSAATARLADTLCRRLEAQGRGARRLELMFQRVDGTRQLQRIALARPSRTASHIARLFDARMEQVDPGEGIEAMALTAVVAETLDPGQAPLCLSSLAGSDPGDHALTELAALIDRLGNRLGARRLWRPTPVQSDVPERSVRAMPPLEMPSLEKLPPRPGRTEWPGMWPAALPRPIRLFDPPMPVHTLTTLPDHPPSFFVWRNHRHRICRADGPERIAGEWWRRSGELQAVRDYFRLEDETGRRFWLFRRGDGADAATGDLRWFLHGLF